MATRFGHPHQFAHGLAVCERARRLQGDQADHDGNHAEEQKIQNPAPGREQRERSGY